MLSDPLTDYLSVTLSVAMTLFLARGCWMEIKAVTITKLACGGIGLTCLLRSYIENLLNAFFLVYLRLCGLRSGVVAA